MFQSSRLSSVRLSVCLSRVRSQKLSEIGVKYRRLYRKLEAPNKNMTSDFAQEVVKYPQKNPRTSQFRQCASLVSLR